MVLFPSLVNGKVANGGRENDRGNLGCSSLGIPDPPSAGPLLELEKLFLPISIMCGFNFRQAQ